MLLKLLFYMWGVAAILFEMLVLYNPRTVVNFVKESKKIKELKDKTNNQKNFMYCSALYALWTIIGLLSSQWILFTGLLILAVIPKGNIIILKWLDALITLILLLFIFINSFHLHINLWEYIHSRV